MRIIVNMITIIVLLVCVALNIGATVYEHKTTYPNKKSITKYLLVHIPYCTCRSWYYVGYADRKLFLRRYI